MTQTEEIVILNVQTGEAVQNMADLRSNVSILKKELDNLEIGSEEYQNTLNELKLNQNALKDAMYATSSSMADVSQSAAGMNESYNSLVHRMAALKEEFRSTTDVMRRAELGTQIKAVNDELKALDALQGNFQRNVGNYTESIKQAFTEMPQYAEPLKKAFEGVDKTMGVMSHNPLIGIITLLFPLIQKITEELKGNQTAIEAVDKAMVALKPVTDFFSRIIQSIADFLADIITKVATFVQSNGLIQQVINGVMGVGNAILQFVIAPFKGIVSAIKVLQDEGVKGLRNAAKAFGAEMKSGISFKQNFEAGQAVATALVGGVNSKKNEVKEAVASGIKDGVEDGFKLSLAEVRKALAEADRMAEEARKLRLQEQKEIDDLIQADIDATNAEIEAMFAEMERQQEEALHHDKEMAQARVDTVFGVADATSSILGTIADLYDENADKNADAAKKAKNVRIASATIDTISGAIAAYMQSVASVPPPFGQILGAAQAAAVTAAGMANIAKMRSTNISTSGEPSVGATVSAPVVSSVAQTPVTNESLKWNFDKEGRRDNRVYILQSDIEAAGRSSRARVAESTF